MPAGGGNNRGEAGAGEGGTITRGLGTALSCVRNGAGRYDSSMIKCVLPAVLAI